MEKRVTFTNEASRAKVLLDNAGLILLEDARHVDGNYLVFSDEPRPAEAREKTIREELEALKARVALLEQRP